MRVVFITASGTEIGKTFITTLLIRQLRAIGAHVEALKPVISGFCDATSEGSDTVLILEALDRAVTPSTLDAISPWRFKAALSPDMAAQREGVTLDYRALLEACRRARSRDSDGILMIEGVGGVMVPLTGAKLVIDWIADLHAEAALDLLLVVGSYLGTISHTLTAVEALRARELEPSAIVMSESPESPVPLAETSAAIARFLPEIPIALVPRAAVPSVDLTRLLL